MSCGLADCTLGSGVQLGVVSGEATVVTDTVRGPNLTLFCRPRGSWVFVPNFALKEERIDGGPRRKVVLRFWFLAAVFSWIKVCCTLASKDDWWTWLMSLTDAAGFNSAGTIRTCRKIWQGALAPPLSGNMTSRPTEMAAPPRLRYASWLPGWQSPLHFQWCLRAVYTTRACLRVFSRVLMGSDEFRVLALGTLCPL